MTKAVKTNRILRNIKSTIKNEIVIVKVANESIFSFVENFSERSFSKDFKCFSYNFVFINQEWKRRELFEKQKEASNKNGTVGKIGKKIPIAPRPQNMNPAIA